jgi:Fe-S-cluster containining protein
MIKAGEVIQGPSELPPGCSPYPSERTALKVGFLPCDGCTGYCCKVYTVYITSFDVARIAASMHLEPLDFIVWYEKGTSNYPTFRIGDNEGQLALGKKADGQSCLFLMESSGRCGVNRFKPMVCRTYPMDFAPDGQMILCRGSICPELRWPPVELYEYFVEQGRRFTREFSYYRTMVDYWNLHFARSGTLRDFMDFTVGESDVILRRCQ